MRVVFSMLLLVGFAVGAAEPTQTFLAFLPLQLPAGIVISLIGGPFFLLLLWQRRDRF